MGIKVKENATLAKKLLKNRHKLLYTNVNNYDAEHVFNETEN